MPGFGVGPSIDGVYVDVKQAVGHSRVRGLDAIEERHVGGVRTAVVTLAAVGHRVRILRRFTAQRRRTRHPAELDVLLTRQGDLAWR
jgi:hypothetical protein